MIIYVSGGMSGLPDKNYPAFNRAARILRCIGHIVVNPAEMDEGREDWTWEQCLSEDIKALVDCDGIYMLKGWRKSKGAVLEYYIAKRLGKQIEEEGRALHFKIPV